jgi:hypothetical protein
MEAAKAQNWAVEPQGGKNIPDYNTVMTQKTIFITFTTVRTPNITKVQKDLKYCIYNVKV